MLKPFPFLLLVVALTPTVAWSSTPCERPLLDDPCDSLFLTNGKAFAIKNLQTSETEARFSFCDDSTNHPQSAPWMQIRRIKKADGAIIMSPLAPKQSDTRSDLEKKVDKVLLQSALSIPLFLLFVGPFLGVYAFLRTRSLLKKIKGQPGEDRLRRKLRWATFLSCVAWGIPLLGVLYGLGVLIWIFVMLSKEQ